LIPALAQATGTTGAALGFHLVAEGSAPPRVLDLAGAAVQTRFVALLTFVTVQRPYSFVELNKVTVQKILGDSLIFVPYLLAHKVANFL
jgi:hypothetical protein